MSVHPSFLADAEESDDSSQLSEQDSAPVLSTCSSLSSLDSRSPKAANRPCNSLPLYSAKKALMQAAAAAAAHLQRSPNGKFDFESPEGQSAASEYLGLLESLCSVLAVRTSSRQYRLEFTQAYQVLYTDSDLGYLSEIIDAAQEQIPYLWVNGEQYEFSNRVLEKGSVLYQRFVELHDVWNLQPSTAQLRTLLGQMDEAWAHYERLYVLELITIETSARWLVRKAIQLDHELTCVFPGPEYAMKRKELVEVLGKLNSVANDQGRGRDDLSYQVLLAAEEVLRHNCDSLALRRLCLQVKESFTTLRLLFRRYSENIEEVDPQLRNNPELVEALVAYESSWEKGQAFVVNRTRFRQLLHFSRHLEELAYKHPAFNEQLKDRDAQVFLTLPALLVLLKLEDVDEDAAAYYCPSLEDEGTAVGRQFARLERLYKFGALVSRSSEEYVDLLERAVLELDYERAEVLPTQYDNLDETLKLLKGLAMQVTRHVPLDWNLFVDAALAEY